MALEKEWNHMEVRYEDELVTSAIKAMGIHVFDQEKEDIRFTDPNTCGKRKLNHYLNSFESDNNS